MPVDVTEDLSKDVTAYASVPIAFEAHTRFDVSTPESGLTGIRLVERHLEAPFHKDYDWHAGSHPTEWPARFDIANWGMLVARDSGRRVGGAVVAWQTPGLDILEGRADLAALWDIRVMPEMRGRRIGSALLGAAETWAAARGARSMKIETQNVNPEACRFYSARGYTLGGINRFAYDELPDEVQLLWYRELE